ncbi:MAG: hypothetical protein ABIQ88_21830 [Chitinophagaceae bacterium]
MATRKITLKTAKKNQGSLSRARVQRVVAEVYAMSRAELQAITTKKSEEILLTVPVRKAVNGK